MGHKCKLSSNMSFGIKFSILSRMFKCRIDEEFKAQEITAVQASTIRAISHLTNELGREVTITDLTDSQKLSHSTMVEIIKKLEAKGFVSSSKSMQDKRSRSIKLTSKAEGFISSITNFSDEVYESLCAGIPKKDIEVMERVIDKMLINSLGGEE